MVTAPKAKGCKVKMSLRDARGNEVKTAEGTIGNDGKLSASIEMENPLKWTAETPNLYTLYFTLVDGNKELEVIPQKTGFRKVEIKNSQLRNGKPISIKGSQSPRNGSDGGYVVSVERMIQDIKIMKDIISTLSEPAIILTIPVGTNSVINTEFT
ncbi:MAG: hypothetical protein V8Q65_06840 [Bacteroidaceae bacterium]